MQKKRTNQKETDLETDIQKLKKSKKKVKKTAWLQMERKLSLKRYGKKNWRCIIMF